MVRASVRQLVIGLTIIQAITPQTLVWQVQRQNLAVRSLIVPSREFEANSVERLFRRLLAEESGKAGFMNVRVYPSFEASSANCKCQSDMNYQVWTGQFQDQRLRPLPGAELFAYGSSAVMMFRDEAGAVLQKVLSVADPTIIGSPACSAKLLHVSSTPPSDNSHSYTDATFFLRSTGEPSKQCAKELSEELSRRTKLDKLDLWVRSDSWFVEDERFPIVYAYEKILEPPSEVDYRASKTAGCFANAGTFSCWEK